jgi:uncharacterized protein (TIGR04255 family)
MAKVEEYSKPPVSEALIDVRIDLLPSEHLQVLESIQGRVAARYPTKKVRHRIEGSVEIQGPQVITAPIVTGPIGYWFESSDRRSIIQARLDGFTFNLLKPDPAQAWPGWAHLETDAREAWNLYAQVINVAEITRFGVRYINTIEIPAPSIELSDYFTAAPRVPESLPYQDILNFQSAVTVKIPEHKAIAIIKYAPSKKQLSGITVTLDIDVFRSDRVSLSTFPLWETLSAFRTVKNAIFESNLQPKARELFR